MSMVQNSFVQMKISQKRKKQVKKTILFNSNASLEKKGAQNYPEFRLITACLNTEVLYAISDESLYELTFRNYQLTKKLITKQGFELVEHICYFKQFLYCVDRFGFFYSFDIKKKKGKLLREKPFENVKGISCSKEKVFILHSS